MKVGDWVSVDNLKEFPFCIPDWQGCIGVVTAITLDTHDLHYGKRGGKVEIHLTIAPHKQQKRSTINFPMSCLTVLVKKEEIKNG